jgi:hypothetical protein
VSDPKDLGDLLCRLTFRSRQRSQVVHGNVTSIASDLGGVGSFILHASVSESRPCRIYRNTSPDLARGVDSGWWSEGCRGWLAIQIYKEVEVERWSIRIFLVITALT